jgi:hypothetical protein
MISTLISGQFSLFPCHSFLSRQYKIISGKSFFPPDKKTKKRRVWMFADRLVTVASTQVLGESQILTRLPILGTFGGKIDFAFAMAKLLWLVKKG